MSAMSDVYNLTTQVATKLVSGLAFCQGQTPI